MSLFTCGQVVVFSLLAGPCIIFPTFFSLVFSSSITTYLPCLSSLCCWRLSVSMLTCGRKSKWALLMLYRFFKLMFFFWWIMILSLSLSLSLSHTHTDYGLSSFCLSGIFQCLFSLSLSLSPFPSLLPSPMAIPLCPLTRSCGEGGWRLGTSSIEHDHTPSLKHLRWNQNGESVIDYISAAIEYYFPLSHYTIPHFFRLVDCSLCSFVWFIR